METKKRILVVEDHDLLLLAIRDILEVEGYEVVTATDGLDALEVMKGFEPELIVADISMPRMDGYQFFDAVRGNPQWVPIPFIFLTARAEREDRLRGKAMGAEDYITKPFDPQELVVVISSRIGRAKAIRQATETEFEDLKQQIITLLSHELRTPLTSVYGYTELALEEATSLPAGDFQQFLMGIKKGADRLTNLVEDLLMVVRTDTGQLEREFRLLGTVTRDIGEVVRQAVRLYEAEARSHGIEIEVMAAPDLPPVKIYQQFLVDAISRLMDNAIKFSRKSGKHIFVRTEADNGMIHISIEDEGVGIPESELNKLFERFRQINRAKMEQQGTGLGLVIARALVNCMQGDITAKSVQGKGSTFSVHLPIATED
ncbi:MAG: response regulator [Anaerolineae bacterium]|nr:response regulator [Anaerolineae bacterium]